MRNIIETHIVKTMPNLLNIRQFNSGTIFTLDAHVVYTISNPRLKSPEGVFLETGKFETSTFYRLQDFESETTQALLIARDTEYNGRLYHELSMVEVSNRRRGYCSFLYKYAITESDLPIISDKLQTLPGSVSVWKKLRFKWRQSKYEIGYIDLKADRIHVWNKNTQEHLIWGMPGNMLSDFEEFGDEDLYYDMLKGGDISQRHYDFLVQNKDYLKDRGHIRLYVGKK